MKPATEQATITLATLPRSYKARALLGKQLSICKQSAVCTASLGLAALQVAFPYVDINFF
jgi:hypothetical protein